MPPYAVPGLAYTAGPRERAWPPELTWIPAQRHLGPEFARNLGRRHALGGWQSLVWRRGSLGEGLLSMSFVKRGAEWIVDPEGRQRPLVDTILARAEANPMGELHKVDLT